MDMSNKSLALLLVAAIVISLGGTLISLNELNKFGITGLASDTGKVELTVSSNVSCVVDHNVTFGSGGQPPGTISIDTDTNNAWGNDCSDGAGTNYCKGLEINNTGNVNINVSFSSDKNGTGFLQGPNADPGDFQYYIRNGTYSGAQPGCRDITGATSFTNVSGPNIDTYICGNLTYIDTNDMMTMEFNVTIDDQTPATGKTATLTITCLEV